MQGLHESQQESRSYLQLQTGSAFSTRQLDEIDNASPQSSLAHEVGLVSLSAGNDPKYIGPSSGYFFTKLLLTATARTEGQPQSASETELAGYERDSALSRELFQSTPTDLPASRGLAMRLSDAYFRTVHQQYPFLHQPTHESLVNQVYDSEEPDIVAAFQVNLVLSISAIILSRRTKVPLPAEGWCANAMEFFSKMHVESSIKGIQCLLLLLIFSMHSPSAKFNAWVLNYQCIAMVLDLGLQRDVSSAAVITPLEQEMRTRIFWVVYSLDRSLGTMMGRPIGLRDEACDLRVSIGNLNPVRHVHS